MQEYEVLQKRVTNEQQAIEAVRDSIITNFVKTRSVLLISEVLDELHILKQVAKGIIENTVHDEMIKLITSSYQ